MRNCSICLMVQGLLLLVLPISAETLSGVIGWDSQVDGLFKMCEVMPGEEVAQLSPFNMPLKRVEEIDPVGDYAGCSYELADSKDFASIKIEVVRLKTIAEAGVDFQSYVQGFKDLYGREPDHLQGLGNKAAYFGQSDPGKCDECGLHVLSKDYFIDVLFKGVYEKIPQRAKQESAIRIFNRLVDKKPFLRAGN